MGAAPLLLSYDDLPPGSDIRRERDAAGVVRITIPAGDMPSQVLHQLRKEALVSGAMTGVFVMLIAQQVVVAAMAAHWIVGFLRMVAWAAFGVACAACMLLFAAVHY